MLQYFNDANLIDIPVCVIQLSTYKPPPPFSGLSLPFATPHPQIAAKTTLNQKMYHLLLGKLALLLKIEDLETFDFNTSFSNLPTSYKIT